MNNSNKQKLHLNLFDIDNKTIITQFSSFQSVDRLGRRGDKRDHSAEIIFQAFLQEAVVSTGMSTL